MLAPPGSAAVQPLQFGARRLLVPTTPPPRVAGCHPRPLLCLQADVGPANDWELFSRWEDELWDATMQPTVTDAAPPNHHHHHHPCVIPPPLVCLQADVGPANDWELFSRWEDEPWGATMQPTVVYTVQDTGLVDWLIQKV